MKKSIKDLRHVVKRKNIQELYDSKKVYASVYAAALNCHYGERKSEKVALDVMKKINSWVKSRKVINSTSIRDEVLKELDKIDKDVALMYRHHLDLS